jgi:hypothetical protein
VRFVKDNGRALGQDTNIRSVARSLLDAEVRKEEVMVDDDDVALRSAAAHLGDEAAVVLRALLSGATVGASVELRP